MSEAKPTELLPCPFCGASASLTDVRMSGHTFRVGCYNEHCGVRPATDYYGCREQPSSAQEVIMAWNTRTHSPAQAEPIPMVLYCPFCGEKHVDEPKPEIGWDDPPHRSHECQKCKRVWRPADVPTRGVREIATKGKADTPFTGWVAQRVLVVASEDDKQ